MSSRTAINFRLHLTDAVHAAEFTKGSLTQVELAEKAGAGLRFVRDPEQGKRSLRTYRADHVLELFGSGLNPAKKTDLLTKISGFGGIDITVCVILLDKSGHEGPKPYIG